MKVFVVGGGGLLGSTTAFCIAERGLADEIVLYDICEPMARHQAFDLTQGSCLISGTKIRAGGWEDIAGADLVISASGLTMDTHSRDNVENLKNLKPQIVALATHLKELAPDAVVLTMTNPIDLFSYMVWKLSGLPRERFLGFCINDTIRMREGLAILFGEDARDIEAYVAGEHSPSKVQLYSTVKVRGEARSLTEEEKTQLNETLRRRWEDFLSLGIRRTAGWTSAVGAVMMVEAMYGRRSDILPCSVIPDGEYGLRDISVGLPVKLCPGGVEQIVELPITRQEARDLAASVKGMRDVLDAAADLFAD